MDDMVWVLPSCGGMCGEEIPAGDAEVIVPVRPGGGWEPKMLEKAALAKMHVCPRRKRMRCAETEDGSLEPLTAKAAV